VLEAAGCDNIFENRGVPGAALKRPTLGHALTATQAGGVLIVRKLDRLGRDLPHPVNPIHDLTTRGLASRSCKATSRRLTRQPAIAA